MEFFLFFKLRNRIEELEFNVVQLQQQIDELNLELQLLKMKDVGRE